MDAPYHSSLPDSRSKKRVRFSSPTPASSDRRVTTSPPTNESQSFNTPSSAAQKPTSGAPSTAVPSVDEAKALLRNVFNNLPAPDKKISLRELFNSIPTLDPSVPSVPPPLSRTERTPSPAIVGHSSAEGRIPLRDLFDTLVGPQPSNFPLSQSRPSPTPRESVADLWLTLRSTSNAASPPPPICSSGRDRKPPIVELVPPPVADRHSPRISPSSDAIIIPDDDVEMGPVFIDLTVDQPTTSKPSGSKHFIDLTVTDSPNTEPTISTPVPSSRPPPADADVSAEEDDQPYVFNTYDAVLPRKTIRSWAGNYRPENWIFREDLHADQVDRDRVLPSQMSEDGYPHFFISAQDLQAHHKYLAARYSFSDYETYQHILAAHRNTRAIEASNARKRHAELLSLSEEVETSRRRILRLLRGV